GRKILLPWSPRCAHLYRPSPKARVFSTRNLATEELKPFTATILTSNLKKPVEKKCSPISLSLCKKPLNYYVHIYGLFMYKYAASHSPFIAFLSYQTPSKFFRIYYGRRSQYEATNFCFTNAYINFCL